MKISRILTLLTLATLNPAFALSTLPEHVYIKNPEQSFSSENYYALKDGKIWIKANELTTGKKGEWKLFDGTGVPFGKEAKSFGKDDYVKEIAQEGLMVIALSNKGRFYTWQPTYEVNTIWREKLGTPFPENLMLPKSKTWTFSVGVARAPEKRLTPMKDLVSYWEDLNGKKTEFGLTATIYTLDPNGKNIRYWDTGLPPSFSRAFVSPERGKFVIEKMSAAGSTLFVIDKYGKMYTRMYDYEINGACPGLRFTYDKNETKNDDKEKVYKLFESVRTMPLDDWREQEQIELNGQAAITTNVTILLTGEGNAARELRVQGRDSNGNYGHYFKPIFAKEWDFLITGEVFDDEEIIENYMQDRPEGKTLDKNYTGSLQLANFEKLKVELRDFYYFNSLSTIRVHHGDKYFDMKLHAVDAWGPTVQQKDAPELIGSILGEPKLMKGTLEIPEEILNSDDAEVKKITDTYFRKFHLLPFAFEISANDVSVAINSRMAVRETTEYMDIELNRPMTMNFKRDMGPDESVEVKNGYMYMANMPGLEINNSSASDIAVIEKAISDNNLMLKEIKRIKRGRKLDNLHNAVINGFGSGVWYILNGVVSILNVPNHHTLIGGLTKTGGGVLFEHSKLNFKLLFASTEDYKNSKALLKERIKAYKKLLKEAKKKVQ